MRHLRASLEKYDECDISETINRVTNAPGEPAEQPEEVPIPATVNLASVVRFNWAPITKDMMALMNHFKPS